MEQNTNSGSARVTATLFATAAVVIGALVLWLGSGAAGMGTSNEPANQPSGGPAANAAATPKADPKVDEPATAPAEAPVGTVQDNGLAFKLPFDRGEGSLVLARQGNTLRVDALIRYPYYAGDGSRDRGSVFALTLSVSGTAGRQMLYYPSPIWQGGPPPLFRVEGRYSKDDGITQLQEEPSFSGSCDVKSWDSWRATLLVDLRMVLVPGTSPAEMADNWMAAIVAGNEVAQRRLYRERTKPLAVSFIGDRPPLRKVQLKCEGSDDRVEEGIESLNAKPVQIPDRTDKYLPAPFASQHLSRSPIRHRFAQILRALFIQRSLRQPEEDAVEDLACRLPGKGGGQDLLRWSSKCEESDQTRGEAVCLPRPGRCENHFPKGGGLNHRQPHSALPRPHRSR
jgi:hypothetical protein